jgi:hypothetical protein
VPRQPTEESFIPIGHISLDSKNPDVEHIDLNLPSGNVFWIKTFYVSRTIQGQGIGRAAMDEVEAMAVRESLLAKTLMLDTVYKDDQKSEEFAIATFGGVPKVSSLGTECLESNNLSPTDDEPRMVCPSRLPIDQDCAELLQRLG